jgi:6,7-dimethyl-8-ribityllumazine synthase
MAGTAADRPPPRMAGISVAILVSRFHETITEGLLAGAREAAAAAGLGEEATPVFRLPGAWELPVAAQAAAASGRFDAVVALGCVVRGETPHFDYVAGEASRGLASVAREHGVPLGFGLLTTDDEAQAARRAAPGAGNKGREAMVAALETLHTLRAIRGPGEPPA